MILHILRTDLRRSRLSLLAYLASLALLATVLNLPSTWQQRGTQAAIWMLAVLGLASLLTANVLLADSPADDQAHWLGRPIGWPRLLAAKLLYIGLAIWLPLVLFSGGMWLATFTPGQALSAGLEIGLYAAGLLALVAALAAASSKLTGCVLYTAAMWGCLIIGSIGLGLLREVWQPPRLSMRPESFVLLMPMAVLLIGLILTCWQFRARSPRQTLLPLALLFALVPLAFPNIRSRPQAPNRAPDSLQMHSTNIPGDGQILHHNLRLQGLAGDQFAIPQELQVRVQGKTHGYKRQDHIATYASALIQAQLPADSSLSWQYDAHRREMSSLLRLAGKVGPLEGSSTLAIAQLSFLGELALQSNATLRAAGYHATVSQIDSSMARIEYSQPQLRFTRDRGVHRPSERDSIYVAYNPARKQARILVNRAYAHSDGIWPMLQIGSGQFSLAPGEERLYIFRVAILRRHRLAFRFPEHRVQGPRSAPPAPGTFSDNPADILTLVPLRSSQRKQAYDILNKDLSDVHLAALVEALPRDPELARFLRQPEWVQAAREPLLALLARRRPGTPAPVILHAAALPDADLADLRWHLLHSYDPVEALFQQLRKRPDFDADSALAEAWARRRLLGMTDLHSEALRAGLPGAFEDAVREELERRSGRLIEHIEGFFGERSDFAAWLIANAPQLQYDPGTGKYLRAPAARRH
jgi:hypothetical protein